ncbi:Transposable element P transposase-like Protein [Tribolium castaneum]|uniref:Transposable element P transposase-like Protein n=1 Tax=Tribolium castaneum TaxID=7070 RepID=D6WHP5_TRICA|nr:Transposable element P transposase-like Protein [Tribolium castaneum]
MGVEGAPEPEEPDKVPIPPEPNVLRSICQNLNTNPNVDFFQRGKAPFKSPDCYNGTSNGKCNYSTDKRHDFIAKTAHDQFLAKATDEKASLVKSCLQFVHESGVTVLSVTFDGAPANFQMVQILGADFAEFNSLKTSFQHPITDDLIFIFPDACHMLKLVRNCLATYSLITDGDGGKIEWKFLEKLVELQCEEGLHAGTKIRTRHIKFAKEKMKVRLAAQTLSKSVSDALLFLKESGKTVFIGAAATAKFIKIFNDLFDMFNSKNRLAKYFYKKPLSPVTKNEFFRYLIEIKEYIKQLKINNRAILNSGRKTGFLGFMICIESLIQYYEHYVEEKGFLKYISTYKLSQDHLELFFGAIRSKGGFNNNPTARQFEAAYKRLIVHHEIKSGDTGNVINLDSTTILNCSSRGVTTNASGEENIVSFEEELKYMDEFDFQSQSSSWDLTDYVLDVVSYISGFVVKSLNKSVTCMQCLRLLEGDRTFSKLQQQKEYRHLYRASQMVVSVCQNAEKYFRYFHKTTGIFNKNIENLPQILIVNTMRNLPSSVMDVFGDHLYDDDPLDNHFHKLVKLILKGYFKLRIHHEARKSVDKIDRIRTSLNKTILFKNQ